MPGRATNNFKTGIQMSVRELLRKKRDGEALTRDEIEYFIKEMVEGKVYDSQTGAMLMAMYIRGLSDTETAHLTRSMVSSGEQLAPQGVTVDKHSTGGVGDKISLILAPVLAACGFKVPMVSGRSLEHTGGTLDKLESIPGFKVDLSLEMMQEALNSAGCSIVAATSRLCPADKMLYRMRDITSTVDCINLIVASIISKKVASGTKFLVLDVKVGTAAFCKSLEMARSLAKQLISVAGQLGVRARAVLSRMDQPLGDTVGNALEVAEAVQSLAGIMHPDVRELVQVLATNLLEMTGYKGDAAKLVEEVVENGSAMDHFQKMLLAQGVDEEIASALVTGEPVLPTANHMTELKAHTSGWVAEVDAMVIAEVCQSLGASGTTSTSTIDPAVGVVLSKHIGDKVSENEVWLTVHHTAPALSPDTTAQLTSALVIQPGIVCKPDIVIEVIQ